MCECAHELSTVHYGGQATACRSPCPRTELKVVCLGGKKQASSLAELFAGACAYTRTLGCFVFGFCFLLKKILLCSPS